MPEDVLEALLREDRAQIGRLADYHVPPDFPGEATGLVRLRRDQLAADPSIGPWLLRAIVRREDRVMVGYVNFHGPPGVNDTMTVGAVELGWTVFPEYRQRGYATETANALMEWAAREFGIRRFVSSTTPENAASLRVHAKLGFVPTGEVVDGEVSFRLAR